MSLIGLQTAVAAIIRHPRIKNKWDPQEFLSRFDLTVSERRIVEKLSLHKELNKYAKGQAEERFEVMKNHCDRIPRFVSNRVLKNIWFDLFEPIAMYAKSDLRGNYESSLSFLNFLLVDKNAQKRLKRSAPQFIFDMIKFEIAELELSRPLLNDPPLAEGSLLSHSHFRIVEFDYDLPTWLNEEDIDDLESLPEKRPVILLFVKSEYFPKIFEIHGEFKDFLESQLGSGVPLKASKEMKENLRKIDLLS